TVPRLVSTSTASAITWITCSVLPTSSATSVVTTAPESILTLSINLPEKFGASILMLYTPGNRLRSEYRPSSLVLMGMARLLASSVMVTLTLGTAAPVGSVTVPSIAPVGVCPQEWNANNNTAK